MWFYLDGQSQQKGPIPVAVLTKMLEKGLGGIVPSTMVWQPEMKEWKPASQVRMISFSETYN